MWFQKTFLALLKPYLYLQSLFLRLSILKISILQNNFGKFQVNINYVKFHRNIVTDTNPMLFTIGLWSCFYHRRGFVWYFLGVQLSLLVQVFLGHNVIEIKTIMITRRVSRPILCHWSKKNNYYKRGRSTLIQGSVDPSYVIEITRITIIIPVISRTWEG